MATFAKVRALPSALVLTFVLALSFAGAGVAHAAPRTTTKAAAPQTCYWDNSSTFQSALLQVYVDHTWLTYGDYAVQLQYSSCYPETVHRAIGYFSFYVGAGAICATDFMQGVELFHNHVFEKGSGNLNDTLGDTHNPPGCASNTGFVYGASWTGPADSFYCVQIGGVLYWNNFEDTTRWLNTLAAGYGSNGNDCL